MLARKRERGKRGWKKGRERDNREGREERKVGRGGERGREEKRRTAPPPFEVDYDGDPGAIFIVSENLIEIVHEPKSE